MRIWKEPLVLTDTQTVFVPHGAQFLTAQLQHDELQLWFLCDENEYPEDRTIAIYGTGNPLPDSPGAYIATVQMDALVWHIFDATEGARQ